MPHTSLELKASWRRNPFDQDDRDEPDARPQHHRDTGVVIDDPATCVDGRTLTQWTEQWYRWAVPTPGPTTDQPAFAFHDPTGSVAAALNKGCGPMYFITPSGTPGSVRSFDVPLGKAVLVGIAGVADSEGPGIEPTLPGFTGSYADEVRTVLASAQFSDGAYQLDGGKTVTDLPVVETGIFNAGYAAPGSAGATFFFAQDGAVLKTTGAKGYWVVLDDLSPGRHVLTGTGHLSSPILGDGTSSFTDIINVVRPG